MSGGPNVKVVWSPHPGRQAEFMNANEFEVLYGGARGGGKSEALIALLAEYAPNKHYRGLLLRRTFPQLLQIRQRAAALYKQIDPWCNYNKDDNIFSFSSGATIQLGHVQHDDNIEIYRGQEYQTIGFDELTHFKEAHYEEIKLSCRTSDATLIPRIRATANPGGIGHLFVRRRFIDSGPPNTVITDTLPDGKTLTRRFIPAKVYDNPTLMKNNPQYEAVLKAIRDPRLRAMMLEGDWDAAEGLYFGSFSREDHVESLTSLFPQGAPRDGMPIYASLDWGFSKPFAIHWHTIDRYDRVITFREWYGIKIDPVKNQPMDNVGIRMLAADVAKGFLQRNEGLKVEFLVADPSIKIQTGTKNKEGIAGSILQEFQLELSKAGIPVFLGNNDRAAGWMQVHNRLSDSPSGKPWWTITDNCIHLIRTIASAPEDPDNPDDVDTDYEDHALDSVRYFFMKFPLQLERDTSELNRKVTYIDEYRRNILRINNDYRPIVNTYH